MIWNKKIRTFTFSGLVKYFLMKLRGRTSYIRGSCHMCGTCCKSINIEGPKGWFKKEKDFFRIIEKQPDYDIFKIIGRDAYGYLLFCCTKQKTDNSCSCYEDRLPLCRNFPDETLLFVGGGLPEKCGYEIRIGPSFKKTLTKVIEKRQ